MRRSEYQRVAMLDLRRENSFNYDLTEIFTNAGFSEEEAAPIIANITAKGSRISLKEAKDYVKRMQEEDHIGQETCNRICSLMDRYRKYR